jgi:hypothetical protein
MSAKSRIKRPAAALLALLLMLAPFPALPALLLRRRPKKV